MNYTATHTSFYPFWLADARIAWITTRGFTGHVQRNTVFESEVHQKQSVEPIPITKGIGKHLDKFGLINANARMYEPLTGKFLAPDPYVQAPDYSQSFNRYAYCWNNPVKYSDPSGYNYQYYIDGLPISGRVFRMKMQGFYYGFDNDFDRLEFVRDPMDKSSQSYNYNISLMEKYLSKNDKKYGMYIQNNKPMTLSWEERKTMYELYGKVDAEYADKMINLYDNNVQSVLEFVPLYDFFWNFCLLNYNNSSSFEKIIDNTIMLPIDFLGASKDFIVNYKNMRKLNLVNSDKYFHSKANFEATKRGPGGKFFAIHFSNLREILDQRIKGDSKYESLLDQEANIYGRIRGEEYRYYYGPVNYQKFIPKYRKNYFSDEY